MGMILVALVLSAVRPAPADGRTVIPLPKATAATELRCSGALQGAFLSPASSKFLGIRAPASAGRVSCLLVQPKGPPSKVDVLFNAAGPLAVGATGPVILGQDREAVLQLRGEATQADGSAGPATLLEDSVRAALPASKMPQNLVVLVANDKGQATYTVVPLLGRATVRVQTAKNADVEAVVAGHRSGGFNSDASGQVAVVVPAPPGFSKGQLDVKVGKRVSHAPITLPAAKPVYALAVIGPRDAIDGNATADILAAGADPLGLPPKASELKASATSGFKVLSTTQVQPGLWRVKVQAPAIGDGSVELALGNASRSVALHVSGSMRTGAAPVAQPTAPSAKATPSVPGSVPDSAAPRAVAEAPAPRETRPSASSSSPSSADTGSKPVRPATEVAAKPERRRPVDDDEGFRLNLLVEGGYLSNGGALKGVAPGGQVQLAYRTEMFDLGLSVDALFASSSQTGEVVLGSTQQPTKTTVTSLQVLAGPWIRLRFTDVIGLDLSAGAGIARTTQQIDLNGVVNNSGTATPLAFGGFGGLDLNFGLVRAFAGVRYVSAKADKNGLTGPAGGIAGLAGIGVDLGL